MTSALDSVAFGVTMSGSAPAYSFKGAPQHAAVVDGRMVLSDPDSENQVA